MPRKSTRSQKQDELEQAPAAEPEVAEPAHAKAEEAGSEPPDAPDPEPSPVVMDKGKGKGKGKAVEEPAVEAEEDEEEREDGDGEEADQSDSSGVASSSGSGSMAQRMAKLKELRIRMQKSTAENRTALHVEHNTTRNQVRAAQKAEKAAKLAAVIMEKREAAEEGSDVERRKAWEYSIEDSERWDKKQAKKERRAQFEFTDYDDVARRKYKKDIDQIKPDLAAYNRQKEITLGLAPGTLTGNSVTAHSDKAKASEMDLYRDSNSLVYADHKPSQDDIDRVVGKLNQDIDKKTKRSRKRNEDEGDVTYINERNKVFNKKISRYFDKYTKEIRQSFERGTAL